MKHVGVDPVAHPSRQGNAPCLHGLRREKSMIQTTKPQAHNQHHGQAYFLCQIIQAPAGFMGRTERNAKPPCPFDNEHFGVTEEI
jgi:hypothetical protein